MKTSYTQRFAFWQAVVFLGILGLTSCKKNDPLGLDVQPDGQLDYVERIDSFTVWTSTRRTQAIRSNNLQDYLGYIKSDEYGTTKSNMAVDFTQSIISSSLPDSFDNYIIDSAVLYVRPHSHYGDFSDGPNIHIHRLTEELDASETYYSNFDIPYESSTQVGSFNLSLDHALNSSSDTTYTTINGITYNYKVYRALLDQQTTADLIEWQKDEDANPFNGLAFITEEQVAGNGALFRMNFLASDTRIILYTRSSENLDSSDYQIVFPVTSNATRVSVYEHDYIGASIEQTVADSNVLDQDTFYVQGLGGLKGVIHIPYLNNMSNQGNIAINKAVITLPVQTVLDDTLKMFLLNDDPDGETFNLDYINTNTRHGGVFNEDSLFYQFDVTRTVQNIISEAKLGNDINYGFTLNVEIPALNGNLWQRTKFQGGDNVEFKVYYTDITD